MPRFARFHQAAITAACLAGLTVSAFAQNESQPTAPSAAGEDGTTRGVRVIDEAPMSSGLPGVGAGAPASTVPTFELGNANLKTDNSAGIAIQIMPGPDLQVGTRIAFRVATKKAGYLILVDVDADGKLTQIYPNRGSLLAMGGRESSNFIKAGRTITIPDIGNPLAGFEFVAAPPNGVAMVVAILSDKPVQMIDLPDVPGQFAGREAALQYLTELARSLRIPRESGALQEAKWSFDAKFYVIR